MKKQREEAQQAEQKRKTEEAEQKKKTEEADAKKKQEADANKQKEAENKAASPEKKDQDPLGLGDKPQPARMMKRAAVDEDDDATDEELVQKVKGTMSSEDGNFTICAPQLLHLGRDNRPLWFNGWILDNKFDIDHPRLSTFDSFMLEHKESRAYPDWRLEENNLCCLISDKVFKFNAEEKKALDGIVAIAKDVGALKARTE